jgi:hypothetical protein
MTEHNFHQGVAMSAEKDNSMNKGDSTQKNAGVGQPKSDQHSQSGDKSRKDMDSARHPDEPAVQPKEFTKKDNKSYGEKSDRA